MEQIERIDSLLKEIEDIGEALWKQETDVYQKLGSAITGISQAIKDYIGLLQDYQIEDIDIGDIIEKLKKIISGFDNKDVILLADTLNYEIYNMIVDYRKLLVVIEEEENELVRK